MRKRLPAALLAAAMLLQIPAAAEHTAAYPFFAATYLQGWLCRDWTPERWQTEFADMKAAGFRSVILQSAVDLTYTYTDESKPKTDPAAYTLESAYALCPTALVSGSAQAHALGDALEAAAESGMQVWIGTVSDSRWWAYGWSAPDDGLRTWAADNAAACSTLIGEIDALYGEAYAPQIAGYYYNNEIWNIPEACTRQDQGAYTELLGANLRETLHAAAEKPVLVSPFYNTDLSTAADYAAFLSGLAEASGMRRTDILAPQDGGGRGYAPDVICQWMQTVQQAVRDSVTFWVNNECFDSSYQPKPLSELKSDYLAANCAQQHILFSWNHYYHAAANPEYAACEQAFRRLCDTMRGDVNNDGIFDAADACAVCRWFMGDRIFLVNWKAADFDGNGILNAADLSAMKQALLSQ